MPDSSGFLVLLVDSTGHAIKGEKELLRHKIPYKLIPVPRQISSQCGICIRIAKKDREKVLEIMEEIKLDILGVHKV